MSAFEVSGETDAGLALVVQATLHFSQKLIEIDPWLPFPQNSCCFSFGPEGRPMPIGATLLLWQRWPAFTGDCPECGCRVFGYGFGGLLSVGGVMGVCVGCSKTMFRFIGGLSRVGDVSRPVLAGTPYHLHSFRFGGCFGGDRRALVEMLRNLGASHLPGEEWLGHSPPVAASASVELTVPSA